MIKYRGKLTNGHIFSGTVLVDDVSAAGGQVFRALQDAQVSTDQIVQLTLKQSAQKSGIKIRAPKPKDANAPKRPRAKK